jgi:hypothetical protein
VDGNGSFNLAAITTTHRHGEGQTTSQSAIKHHPVALGDAGGRERETPEAIATQYIGTGDVENQIGDKARKHLLESAFERLQVRPIGSPVGQPDVKVAARLNE